MVSPIVSQHKLCKSITSVVGHSSGWRWVVQWVDLHITGSLFPAPISTSYILASWSACCSLWQWALRFLHAYEVWIDDGGQSCWGKGPGRRQKYHVTMSDRYGPFMAIPIWTYLTNLYTFVSASIDHATVLIEWRHTTSIRPPACVLETMIYQCSTAREYNS